MRRQTWVGVFLLCAACGAPTVQMAPQLPTPEQRAELADVKQLFFSGSSVADLRRAVSSAKMAAPDSADYHELAALLSHLENRRDDEFSHLERGLLDANGANASRLLLQL